MKRINLEGEFGWEISVSSIRPQLEAAKGEDLDVYLASPGGSVFKGIHVYNLFRDYKREYPNSQNTLTVKGLAASMSSYLMMCPAFDMVVVEDNACFMMHNPYGGVMGDYRDAAAFYKMIEGLTDMMSEAYVKKLKKSKSKIREMLDKEHWAFGEDIVKQGFADEVLTTEEEKNADNAYAMAKMQIKELNQKLRTEEIEDNEIQEVAAMLDSADEYDINMPYPTEHAARIREPGDFEDNSFRRKNIETGIDIIIGKLKGKTTTTTQAYRFKKDKFTADEAKKWLKDHNIKYIKFEAASGSSNEQDPATNTRDNNINQEVKSMTLKEFLEQNPAAKLEYDNAIAEAKQAGKQEIRDIVTKAAPFIGNSEYPKQITEAAVAVIKGERSVDVLDTMVATADMIKELKNSNAAEGETPPDTHEDNNASGQLSEEYVKNGVIMTEADMAAETKRMKQITGQEVN